MCGIDAKIHHGVVPHHNPREDKRERDLLRPPDLGVETQGRQYAEMKLCHNHQQAKARVPTEDR